jgi:hypothetical protein
VGKENGRDDGSPGRGDIRPVLKETFDAAHLHQHPGSRALQEEVLAFLNRQGIQYDPRYVFA